MNAPAVDLRPCPLCGGTERWPLEHYRDPAVERTCRRVGAARPYAWFLCRRCGNGYPAYPPDLAVLAELWKENRADLDLASGARAAVWQHRQRIGRKGAERSHKIFAPLHGRAPGRFLDIACGLGETVRIFADHGWDAFGIDADPNVHDVHRNLGIRSAIGQIETVALREKFDIVHIAHAIYFIAEPRRFLELLQERLAEGGWLCIVLANFMAADDLGLPNYHHSFFPTAGSMRLLLSLAGYQTVFCQSLSGSIYIAARVGCGPVPAVHPLFIRAGYRSKRLRYLLLGLPKLWVRRLGKRLLARKS